MRHRTRRRQNKVGVFAPYAMPFRVNAGGGGGEVYSVPIQSTTDMYIPANFYKTAEITGDRLNKYNMYNNKGL